MRRLFAQFLVCAAIVGGTLGMALPAAAAAGEEDTYSVGLENVASCVQDTGSLLAAIVVDESGSLKDTDPHNLRVNAIKTVLDSLESLASQGANVQVSLATFGAKYTELVGWGSAAGQHGKDVRKAVETKIPDANEALFTDYREALNGARNSLKAQAETSAGDECKLMLWFTDGKLDLENNANNSTGAKTEKGHAQLCDANGIVDEVRDDDITVVALALFDADAKFPPTSEDKAILQSIALGSAPGETCGRQPIAEEAIGAYLPAGNAAELGFVFARAGAQIEGGIQSSEVGCSAEGCVNGELRVPVDAGVGRVRVVANASLEDSPITVLPPGAQSSKLAAGSQNIAGADVRVTTSPGLTVVEVSVPPEDTAAVGDWMFEFGDDATAAEVFYFWDARLVLDVPRTFTTGTEATVSAHLESTSGKSIDPAVYEEFIMDATVNGETIQVAPGATSFPVTIDNDGDDVTIVAHARATTVGNGLELGPIEAKAVATQLPPSYPVISSQELDFGTLNGTTTKTVDLEISGAPEVDSKVCIRTVTVEGPGQDVQISGGSAGADSAGPEGYCVAIPSRSTSSELVSIPVTLTAEKPADGPVIGVLNVDLYGGNEGDTVQTVPIDVSASMVRPVNAWKATVFEIAFAILALIVAWLTALIGRHFADRFRFGPGAQYAAVDVLVTPQGLTRTDKREGDLLDPAEDFHRVSSIGNSATTTSMDIDALRYRRKAPFNPWSAARGVASAPGRIVGFGQHGEMETADGSVARAPFPGTTEFILSADPGGITPEQISGRLVMVLDAPDGVSSVLPDRLADLRQVQWPELILAFNTAAEVARQSASQGSVVEKELAPRVGGSSSDVSTAPAQNFTGEAEPGTAPATQSAPAQSWLLDDSPTASTLPPASTGKRRGRDKKAEKPSKSKSRPAPPSDPSAGAGSPPPPTDFLS